MTCGRCPGGTSLGHFEPEPARANPRPMGQGRPDRLDRRVVILDGAMGTSIHRYDPTDADWAGKDKVNCCDYVAVTHPEWVRDVHRGFLRVGCDAVETNTFNGSRLILAEFGLA